VMVVAAEVTRDGAVSIESWALDATAGAAESKAGSTVTPVGVAAAALPAKASKTAADSSWLVRPFETAETKFFI
jgi:hypothetical protein